MNVFHFYEQQAQPPNEAKTEYIISKANIYISNADISI